MLRVLAWVFVVFLLAGTAWGAPDEASRTAEADRRVDTWSALSNLEVEPGLFRLVQEPLVFQEGPLRLTITDGVLVPVFSGRFAEEWSRDSRRILREQRDAGRPDRLPSESERGSKAFAGFVLSGATATATVRLDDRADAQVLANRLVRLGLSEREAVSALAAGESPLQVEVSEALLLGMDPRLQALYVGSSFGEPDNPDSDVYGVIVYGDRPRLQRDLTAAQQLFTRRMRLYDQLGFDMAEAIAWDRYEGLPWDRSPRHLLAIDLHTDQRFGLVAPMPSAGARDQWLALLRDDGGGFDARRQWTVRSIGSSAQGWAVYGQVGGVPFAPSNAADPTSAPVPQVRIDPVSAKARVMAVPKAQGTLQVDVVADLTVRALGAPSSGVRLEVPITEAEPDSWKLVDVTLPDGTSIWGSQGIADRRALERDEEQRDLPDGDEGDDDDEQESLVPPRISLDGPSVGVHVFFPEPLQPGESITFQVHYTDTWSLRNWGTCYGDRSLGDSTGLKHVLPSLPWQQTGDPWPVDVLVAVPAGTKLRASASGNTVQDGVEKGWRVLRKVERSPARFPGVAIGRWNTQVDPGAQGLPAVRANLFSKSKAQLASVGQQVRQMALYYSGWLPAYPVSEMDVFESPRACGGFVYIAPHGMVALQAMMVEDKPMMGPGSALIDRWLEESVLAHEVAHQYWGHLVAPASIEDFWISETMAEGFSCMYLGKIGGAKVCDRRMVEYRRTWEKEILNEPGLRASLSGAYASQHQPNIVYRYGPYVMHHMLRRKVGTEAYFKALDGISRMEGPLTTERLHAVMELTSGQDLDDWFDYWVYNGFIPDVDLTWSSADGRLRGDILTNVPFGTFDVTVAVQDGERRTDVVVSVVDGVGRFEGPALPDGADVVLDPDFEIVARRRRVRRQ